MYFIAAGLDADWIALATRAAEPTDDDRVSDGGDGVDPSGGGTGTLFEISDPPV